MCVEDLIYMLVFFSGGNELSNQPFHIKWCWISFKQPEYTVAETEGLLEITVHRRGYLGETVYVGMYTKQ